MARRKQKAEVTRVEMTSSASPRPVLVPEAHVERYQSNGWVPVATKATKPRKATSSARADDAGAED